MKLILSLYTVFIFVSIPNTELTLDEVRVNYPTAVVDKSICRSMILQLSENHETDVFLAYLGAYQTIWARHIFNPISKLHTFNKGKRNIDAAARRSPQNVEVILIRHSIQKHSPAFLGYKDMLEKDRNFLKNHLQTISSPKLKKMVETVLAS